MYRTQAGHPDKNGWYQAESTHRHFKIKLPAPFNDFRVPGSNADALSEVSCVGTVTKDTTRWVATVGTYKDITEAKKSFDEPVDKGVTRTFLFRGQPAKEMWIVNPARSLATREILIGRDKYILLVEYDTNNKENSLKSDILKFMDSLEFSPSTPE